MDEDKFSDDPTENANIENEFLKLKLKAQFGNNFMMGGNGQLPPEIENQFLKSLISFEESYKNAEYITIYEKIGKPNCVPASALNDKQISERLKALVILLQSYDLRLDICDGPYPDALIYTFITEELFALEIEKENIFLGTRVFIYEEFYPNNKVDIEKSTHQFLKNWFSKSFEKHSPELADTFITANAQQLTRHELYTKLNLFFEAFKNFENDAYNIDEIKFEELPNGSWVGHAEGVLKYDAIMENREKIQFKGPYKLYMQRTDNYWNIFYFVMPGFTW
jgi:hypothetical protein